MYGLDVFAESFTRKVSIGDRSNESQELPAGSPHGVESFSLFVILTDLAGEFLAMGLSPAL